MSNNRSPSTGARPVLGRATSASRGATSQQLPATSSTRANISSAPPSNNLTPSRLVGIGGPPGEFVGRKPSRLVDTPPAAQQVPSSSSSSVVPAYGRRAPSSNSNSGKAPAAVLGQPSSHGSRLPQNGGAAINNKPPRTNTYEEWMANHKTQHVKAIPIYEKEEQPGPSPSRGANTTKGADPWEYYRSDRGNHQDIDLGRIKEFYNAAVTLDEIEESAAKNSGSSRSGGKATTSASNRNISPNQALAPPTATTGMARRVVEDPHRIPNELSDQITTTDTRNRADSHRIRPHPTVAVRSGSSAPVAPAAVPSTSHEPPQPSQQLMPPKKKPDITTTDNLPQSAATTVKRDAAINSAVRFFFEETIGSGVGSAVGAGVNKEVGMRLEIFDTVVKEAGSVPSSQLSQLAPISINVDLIANVLATRPRGTTKDGEEDRAVMDTLAEDLLTLKHQQKQAGDIGSSPPGGARGKRNSNTTGNSLASSSSEEVVLAALIDVHHRLWKGLHNIVFHCVRCNNSHNMGGSAHNDEIIHASPSQRPSSQQQGRDVSAGLLLLTPVEWLFTLDQLSSTISYPRSSIYSMTPPPASMIYSQTPAQALALFSQLRSGILELLLALMYVVMHVRDGKGPGREESEEESNDDGRALWWVVRFAEEMTTRRERQLRTTTDAANMPLTPSLTNPTAWPPGIIEGNVPSTSTSNHQPNKNEERPVTLDIKAALSSRIEQVERLVKCLSKLPGPRASQPPSLLGALWGGNGNHRDNPHVDEQPTLDTTLGPHRVDAGLRKLLASIHAATTSLLLRRAEQVSIMGKYSPEDYLLCSNTLALNPRPYENVNNNNNSGKLELENALLRPSFDATIDWLQTETRTLTEEAQYLQSMLHSLQRSTNPGKMVTSTTLRSTVNEWSSCCAPVKLARCRRSTAHLLSLLESRFIVEISAVATDNNNDMCNGVADHHHSDEEEIGEDEFDLGFLLHRHHGYNPVGGNTNYLNRLGDDNYSARGGDEADEGPSSSSSTHTILGYAAQEWAHLARSDFTPSERRELMMLCPHLPQPFQTEKANANSMALLYANSWLRQQLHRTTTSSTFNGSPISTKVMATIQQALILQTHDDNDNHHLNGIKTGKGTGGCLVGTSVDITSRSSVVSLLAQCHHSSSISLASNIGNRNPSSVKAFLVEAPFHPWSEPQHTSPLSDVVYDALCINGQDIPRHGVFQESCVGIIPGRNAGGSKKGGGGNVDDEADQRLFSPGARPPPLSSAPEAVQTTSRTTSALVELEALNARLEQYQSIPDNVIRGDKSELKALSTRNWRTRIRQASLSTQQHPGLDK